MRVSGYMSVDADVVVFETSWCWNIVVLKRSFVPQSVINSTVGTRRYSRRRSWQL